MTDAMNISENVYCNSCNSILLHDIYTPPDGLRGLSVFICQKCGLVQSLPRIETIAERIISTSSGAGWGNIRYGKGFRTQFSVDKIGLKIDLKQVKNVLDIGSSRGNFLLELKKISKNSTLIGIEPDKNICDLYSDDSQIQLINDRVQNIDLPKKHFDLVYCSHTLEHLADPFSTLTSIGEWLKPDGISYIEVPNLDTILNPILVEDFFIDKHLYHFTGTTFGNILKKSNLNILEFGSDASNLWAICSSNTNKSCESNAQDEFEFNRSVNNIKSYTLNLADNRKKIKDTAKKISKLSNERRLCIWGAGRIFDALITHGRLDPKLIYGLVDKELNKYLSHTHGIKIYPPEKLVELAPDLLIITSREYFDEIKENSIKLLPKLKDIYSVFEL